MAAPRAAGGPSELPAGLSMTDAFEAYYVADEVGPVLQAWHTLLAATGGAHLHGSSLAVFDHLEAVVMPQLSYKRKMIFNQLRTALSRRDDVLDAIYAASESSETRHNVVSSGAGPVCIRAAA